MNKETIEQLLRKAPPVRTPPGLLRDLQVKIDLSAAALQNARLASRRTNTGWLRRWLPALGFSLWFIGCVVVFGIQASRLAELKSKASGPSASAIPTVDSVDSPSMSSDAAELQQLRTDAMELQRLLAEAGQLREEVKELAGLQAENERLREALKSQMAAANKPEEDFFAAAQDRAVRITCINNLKRVGLAARIWAKDHGDVLPADYEAMKNYFATDKITFCPADGSTRYEILSPGVTENDPAVVFVRCPVHNNVGLVDGSAVMIPGSQRIVQKDDKWVIGQ